jgi:hypothetical protein
MPKFLFITAMFSGGAMRVSGPSGLLRTAVCPTFGTPKAAH